MTRGSCCLVPRHEIPSDLAPIRTERARLPYVSSTLSSRAQRGICTSLALGADSPFGVARAARARSRSSHTSTLRSELPDNYGLIADSCPYQLTCGDG